MRLRLKLNANSADGLIAGYTDVDSYYHWVTSFDAPPALWPAGPVGILLGPAQELPRKTKLMIRSAALRKLTLVSVVFIGSSLLSLHAFADDQETIDYREHIMKTMGEQVAAMNQMRQAKIAPDNLAVHAEILAVTAATAKNAFTPKVAGGEAKPNVWADWQDFSKRLDELVAATADLAKTAKQGGLTATAPKLQALTCKGCHDTYREEKK
jgi:cytochrome c556